ncbi:MAG: glycosyltransferase [bacterium]|nr:glycosyltransferase [bacterium]
MNLSPIVLFVYNRLYYIKETIESLKSNYLSDKSILYIYTDGPKNPEGEKKVLEVRNFLKSIDGFKEIYIIEREKNVDLAENIITGVTEIVNMYGKVIVLEDDLVTSKYFLKYMMKL